MFDVGWTELVLIGVVALIVIGPKDLPEMFRQLGRITAKMRSMAREFQRAMEQAANEAGVKDVAKDLKSMTSAKSMGLDAVKDATSKFEKWDPLKNAARPTVKPLTPPPMPPTPPKAEPAAQSVPEAPASPATIHGPATQAQIDQQAAKSAILKETAARLKAVTNDAVPATPPKPRRKAAVAAVSDGAAIVKPRAARKLTKKVDEA